MQTVYDVAIGIFLETGVYSGVTQKGVKITRCVITSIFHKCGNCDISTTISGTKRTDELY